MKLERRTNVARTKAELEKSPTYLQSLFPLLVLNCLTVSRDARQDNAAREGWTRTLVGLWLRRHPLSGELAWTLCCFLSWLVVWSLPWW